MLVVFLISIISARIKILSDIRKSRLCSAKSIRKLKFKGRTYKIEVQRDVRNSKVRKQDNISRKVSTVEHMQVPNWDRTKCPEE